jgi:hypothetical protein
MSNCIVIKHQTKTCKYGRKISKEHTLDLMFSIKEQRKSLEYFEEIFLLANDSLSILSIEQNTLKIVYRYKSYFKQKASIAVQ